MKTGNFKKYKKEFEEVLLENFVPFWTKYSVDKEQIQKKDGEKYIVSPYYLTWNNENYYLIGVDEKSKEIRHYRVDRMKQIEVSENERIGQELFDDFDNHISRISDIHF